MAYVVVYEGRPTNRDLERQNWQQDLSRYRLQPQFLEAGEVLTIALPEHDAWVYLALLEMRYWEERQDIERQRIGERIVQLAEQLC
ncbi:hypothetical protein HNR42_003362 [Deinobacterium chartae]|uniref:Uncharacterized protein n=1 Tax=Deinobacterium chartae TaxID=521158 RepID=A0A841I7T0_9DEIO|nr:hypothetical protein [Deinobacterium chartae]MBB6099902.1 hypothetical protein [Deinobacterium chartae]